MSQVDGYDYGNDDEHIVDEAPTIYDLTLHTDTYPKKIPDRPPKAIATIIATVTRPNNKKAGLPYQRNLVLSVEDVPAVTLSFHNRDELQQFMNHLVAAIQADDTCNDCGVNIFEMAWGLSSEPRLRFCRACADIRADVPKILPR